MVVTQAANIGSRQIMAEGSELINRSLTICHYTSSWRISKANCNGSRFTSSEIVDLLRLFAEYGLIMNHNSGLYRSSGFHRRGRNRHRYGVHSAVGLRI